MTDLDVDEEAEVLLVVVGVVEVIIGADESRLREDETASLTLFRGPSTPGPV